MISENRREVLPETIRTERLELRPFSALDGPAIYAYSHDPDWAKFQQTTPASEQEAEGLVRELLYRDRAQQPTWAITRSGRVIGIVGLAFDQEHRSAVLGYGIHKDYRGIGLTAEAVRAVLTHAFSRRDTLDRVTAGTNARNHRSIDLLEKLGFVHESTVRVKEKDELVDGSSYELPRSDWSARPRFLRNR